jgi:hypothetical protein
LTDKAQYSQLLLDHVVAQFFPTHDFDLKGKLNWIPETEKEKERYFKRTGKELKKQRRQYSITKVFWEKEREHTGSMYYSNHHHILITDVDDDGIFYCVNDHCVGGRAGQKTRYTFKLLKESNSNETPGFSVELLDRVMIAIR